MNFNRTLGRPKRTEADRQRVIDVFLREGTVAAAQRETGFSYGYCWNVIDAADRAANNAPALHGEGHTDREEESSTQHNTPPEED